jgi:hypothetical protein
MVNSNAKSEFGGGRGRIAPTPHRLGDSSYEQIRMLYATDPSPTIAGEYDTPDAALQREREMEGRLGDTAS